MKTSFKFIKEALKTFLTSLQGPPNVQSPAAWSAMARLNVWNQSSLSPTELKRETAQQSHLTILKHFRLHVWSHFEQQKSHRQIHTVYFKVLELSDAHLAESVIVMSDTSILRQFSTLSRTGLLTCV